VADLLDPDREQHPPERLALGRLDRVDQLAGRHLAEARLSRDLLGVETIEVSRRSDPTELHVQRHDLLAEAVDVHHARKRGQQLPAASRAVAIGAAGEDRALELDGRRLADRAARGWMRGRRAIGALDHVRRGREHLRDHVTGAQHDHLLTLADVLAGEVLLVV
jgi:hypothetical protein